MKPIEIFRPGTHTPMKGAAISFSAADLQASAAAYDPALHEAPIVVGHPKTDGPAYGWIKGLSFSNGALVADPDQIDPAFAEMVQAGRFKKISASFYPPGGAGNPKPDAYYLRHVGFLGAEPPSLKGLKPVGFAEGDEGVLEFADTWRERSVFSLFGRVRDFFIEKFGLEEADRVIPAGELDWLRDSATRDENREDVTSPRFSETTEEIPDMTEAEKAALAQRQADLETREQALAASQTAFAEREAAIRRTTNQAFLDGLVTGGKIAPGIVAPALAFMERLDAAETVEFSEGADKQTALDWFKDLLGKSGQVVDFSERAAGDGRAQVDTADSAALVAKAVEFQEAEAAAGRTVSIDVAVRHVVKQASA